MKTEEIADHLDAVLAGGLGVHLKRRKLPPPIRPVQQPHHAGPARKFSVEEVVWVQECLAKKLNMVQIRASFLQQWGRSMGAATVWAIRRGEYKL